MNKYWFGLVVLALLILVVWFFNRGYTPIKPTAGSNIIFYGDSLVFGVGATSGKSLPELLSQKINMPVINAGKSGDTTEAALLRLKTDVLEKDPKLVIIILGGNDFLRRIPKTQTLENINSIIAQIQNKGAGVVLAGFNATIFGSYNSDYKKIAEEKRTGFVENIFSGILGKKDLMSDTIHPNDLGYAKMVEKIEPVVLEIIK